MKNIGTAVQKSNGQVEVYDENGHYMFTVNGELVGFTSTTVSVRIGSRIEVRDANGHYKFSR